MIELIQFAWSPFCLVQRRILEYAQAEFEIIDIPPSDRSLVWRLTRQRYYEVPIVQHGPTVVFEIDQDSQVVAKYLDDQLQLGLFPRSWAGVQNILWRYFEHEIEGIGFRLNDIYYQEFVPPDERLNYLRFKERKFGHGCINQWKRDQEHLLNELAHQLEPCEIMLTGKDYLLGEQPLFVDFDLYGMLANFLYSGHYKLPGIDTNLQRWYERLQRLNKALALSK
ncbi:MAG: glutathione S-transferase N-terminal domain-containing protein [Candidatus Omnitrophica bacterium]|nr:glutathione S-transferase N-terminal domain-containing protein [Candidatus Omnitrophota bacterium]